jgi:ligand-binding sensor domain-containing protein
MSSPSFTRRFALTLMLIVTLISTPLQLITSASPRDQNLSSIDAPDQPSDQNVSTQPAKVDASLEAAPAPEKAVVVDQANPDWRTVYGTEAGRQLLPPRRSEVPAQSDGAVLPLSGFWITRTIQAGTQGLTAIAYAPDGRLFAAINGLGLRVYGPNGSGIYGWTSITSSPGGLLSNNISALAIFNGELWIGTNGSGVSRYNLTSGAWLSYTVANSPLPNDTINRLTPVIDPNNPDYIWISTNGGGAAKLTPGRPNTWNIINTVDGLPSNIVYDVAVDLNGSTTTTWFANYGGLTSWNGTTFTAQGGGQCTPFFYVTRVIVDRLHRVWYTPVNIIPGRPGDSPNTTVDEPIGVCLRTVGSPIPLVFYTLFSTTSPGLPSNFVSDLSEDYAGRIWMSMRAHTSGTGGGAVYDNGTWRLYTTPSSPLLNDDLSHVLAVGEAVWWGHGTANAFTVHSPNWLRFTATQIGDTPEAIFLEATRTWAGGTTKIAYTTGGAWTALTLPGNTAAVTSFTRDGNNHLWIGTSGNGVFDYNNVTFTPYTTTSGLPNNGVNALLTDHLGRVWAGTNGGLAMRAEAGYWLTFTTSTSPIANNFVEALARDSADRLWIGTASGLSVYNLNAVGGNAWITYTTSNGLPNNLVTGLTTDSAGSMWVSTFGGGVAVSNAVSNTWTIYSTTASLPNPQTLDITSDSSGRIWTTTAGGLALRQGTTWRSFHVPDSSLDSHRLDDVAADADRAWIEGDTSISVRGVLTSPIGNFVPAISSLTPISATPGATIIVNGSHFDDRGPEFNIVKFPDANHFPTLVAEVISVTTTSIAAKVPALASSGKLQVEANGLKSPLSATSFQLKPAITSISPTCLGPGSELKISGKGFLDGSAAAYVKIGSGAERIADATDPTQIRTFIRPGDTSGQVRVRLLNNNQVIANQSLSLATINVNQTKVRQAVEGERLIWGKTTLVQLGATSGGCGSAQITRATLKWKFSTGLTYSDVVNFPNGKALPTSLPNFSLDNAVSIATELNLSFLADDLNLPDNPFISSLAFFTGVDVVLRNNNVDVLTINLPPSKFNFIDTTAVQRHIITMMVTGNSASEQDANYDQTMYANFAHVARMYPQQDGWATGGRYSWLYSTPFWFSYPDKIKIGGDNSNHEDVRDEVDDFLDPGGDTWAVAYIDQKNIASGSGGGIGSSSWHTVVAINQTDAGGRFIAHEVMHAFGFVDSDAPNYQPSDVAGEDHHSKYNENRWDRDGYSFADCSSTRTYRQALDDATGNPSRRVVRLIGPNAPKELRTAACNSAAQNDQSNTAKSIISYAPNRDNYNTVLEPYDYRTLIDQLCGDGGCAGYSAQAALNAPIDLAGLSAANDVTRTLRLSGKIDLSGTVTTSVSYVGINDGAVTPQEPGGEYHLIIRDAAHTVLHDQIFKHEDAELTPHDTTLYHDSDLPQQVNHGAAPVSLFHLRVPFPDNALSAEIVYSGTVLWSGAVSANPPTVNITAPSGGTFNAANPITITWTANDVDSDPLQFGLDYSADDGATWLPINPKIIGNSIAWTPGYVTATNTARVRIRASDGFNTAFSTSAQFELTAKAPEAIILAPDNSAVFAEGQMIQLQGTSLTNDGPDAGSFTWKLDNVTVGTTRTITTPLNAIGVNTITLQVNANALIGTRSITVTVIPDYDRDGLPNAWELQYQLNPLDPTDAAGDADGDGLSNADEYRYGTNPRSADTDGDGFSDSVEINAGTDPLNAASKPNATPILNVGSVSMGFTVNDYSPLPLPKSTWVTNLGGGTLNWNATTDAPWLNVSPASGSTPQQLNVSAIYNGQPTGTYMGHVTVTAPGVSGSPQMITVTLNIESVPNLQYVYLPLVMR